MIIIAIEGVDASGKETQTNMLKEFLGRLLGYKVRVESFPRYHTTEGNTIRKYLINETFIDPLSFHILYDVDKLNFMHILNTERKLTPNTFPDILILDRYLLSNLVYGRINGVDTNIISAIQSKLPKPDITYILDLPAEESVNRKKNNYARLDKFEKDLEFQKRVRENYLLLASNRSKVENQDELIYVIDANRDKEEVHKEIINYINMYLGIGGYTYDY